MESSKTATNTPVTAAVAEASVTSTVFNFATNTIGAGFLSLAWTLRKSSAIPGVLAMVLMAGLNLVSILVLTRCCELSKCYNYREMGEKAGGRYMGIAIQALTGFYTLGSCVSYVVLVGDFLPDVFSTFGDSSEWWSRREFLAPMVALCVLLPLALLRNLSRLQYTSLAALLCILYTGGLLIARAAQGPRADPETVHWWQWSNAIWAAFPITNVSFTLHYNAPRYFQELKDRSMAKMLTIALISFSFCLVLYISTSLSGYVAFGASTQGDVLNSFANSDADVPVIIARMALSFVVSFAFPLALHPLRLSVLNLLPDRIGRFPKDSLFAPITVFLVAFVTFLGVVIPNVEIVLAYKGALFGTCIVYIFPGLMFFSLALQTDDGRFPDAPLSGAHFQRCWHALLHGTGKPAAGYGVRDEDDEEADATSDRRALLSSSSSSSSSSSLSSSSSSPSSESAGVEPSFPTDGSALTRVARILCTTRHGLVVSVFVSWGLVIMVLGTIVATGASL